MSSMRHVFAKFDVKQPRFSVEYPGEKSFGITRSNTRLVNEVSGNQDPPSFYSQINSISQPVFFQQSRLEKPPPLDNDNNHEKVTKSMVIRNGKEKRKKKVRRKNSFSTGLEFCARKNGQIAFDMFFPSFGAPFFVALAFSHITHQLGPHYVQYVWWCDVYVIYEGT